MGETYEPNATQPNFAEWTLENVECECAWFEKQSPKHVSIFVFGRLRMDVLS